MPTRVGAALTPMTRPPAAFLPVVGELKSVLLQARFANGPESRSRLGGLGAGDGTLAFELADPANVGAYQGVSQTGAALGSMLAPLVVTATAIQHGLPGWILLGVLFLLAGSLTMALVRRPVDGSLLPDLPTTPATNSRN